MPEENEALEDSNQLDNPTEHSPGRVFAQYLIQLGLASEHDSEDNWPAYYEVMPDSEEEPRDLIVCSSTTPKNEGTLMTLGRTVQKMGIQVRLAANSDPVSYRKVAELRQEVGRAAPKTNVIIDGVTYVVHRAALDSGPNRMGKKGIGRVGHTLNYTVAILAAID